MISKNFEFIKKIDSYNWLWDRISEIEDALVKNNPHKVIIESAITLEAFLKNYLDTPNSTSSLNYLIKNFTLKYEELYGKVVPGGIISALRYIQKNRNSFSHDDVETDFGASSTSFTSQVNYLVNLRKILHFTYFHILNDDFEINEFDDQVYFQKTNREKFNAKQSSFEYESEEITLQKISIGKLVLEEKNNFWIPPYQRDYCWKKEECQDLWNQILDKYKFTEEVYFGTIACIVDYTENKEFNIKLIDGQQRITTSLILFKAFLDVMKAKIYESGDENKKLPLELANLFEYKENDAYSDNKARKKYINLTAKSDSGQEGIYTILTGCTSKQLMLKNLRPYISKSEVTDNYLWFVDKLNERNLDDLYDLFTFYSNNFILSCINFDDENVNQMEIFENLNSKGKELETFDMIKNYIYNLVDKDVFEKNVNEIIDGLKKYFTLEREASLKGKKNDQNVHYEQFLFNYLTYKNALSQFYAGTIQKNKKSLLAAFKDYFSRRNLSLQDYHELCEGLGRYFYMYKSVNISKAYKNVNSEFAILREVLENIEQKDFDILLFYLFDIYSDNSWNAKEKCLRFSMENELVKCIFEIEKWLYCLLQVKGTGQSFKSDLIKLLKFLHLYEQNNTFKQSLPQKLRSWFAGTEKPTKENEKLMINRENALPFKVEIINSISTRKLQDKYVQLVFLKRLESYWLNHETKANQRVDYKSVSVEHIMPQTLNNEWKRDLALGKVWDDKLEEQYQLNLNRIGNLLLLDKNNNSELKNSSFSVKKNNYHKSDSRLVKIPFTMANENVLDLQKFGFNEIENRSGKLAQLLVEEIYGIK